jgi:hypothetical protein
MVSECWNPTQSTFRARICKNLRSTGTDSKKSIPQAYVAFLNVYGVQESIPSNEYRQPM